MAIRYACFVSYVHGNGQLLQSFKEAVTNALRDELEAFFDELWIDKEMLDVPGQDLESTLAQAICQSVCVVVLFVPKYSSREWCMRELATALRIEKERLAQLKSTNLRQSLVIPIMLRGEEDDLPAELRSKLWGDFRAFSLRNPDVVKDEQQYKTIQDIAKHIYKVYKQMEDLERAGHKWCPDDEKCTLAAATVTPRTTL